MADMKKKLPPFETLEEHTYPEVAKQRELQNAQEAKEAAKNDGQKKIVKAVVNFQRNGRTNVYYTEDGKQYAMYVEGKFTGKVEIEHTGRKLTPKNITKITQK